MINSLENKAIKESNKIVMGEDGIPVYKSLSVIPENLESNTYFKKNGLKHDGIILGRVKCGYFDYPLYDVNTAVESGEPVKPKKSYKKKSKSKKINPDYTGWSDVPENLYTLSQLKNKGLRHNNKIDGIAMIDKKVYYLFDIDKAIDANKTPKGAKLYKTKNKAPENLEGVTYFSDNGILHNGIVKGLYKSSSGYHELYDKNEFVIEDKLRYKNFYKGDNGNSNKTESCDWDKIIEDINKNPSKYIVLDTETTGKKSYDEIIQMSIVDLDGNVLFNSYFKPKTKISEGATEKHGITRNDLKDSPLWSSKWNEISSILKGKTIIAYNAKFDEMLIRETCTKHNIKIDFEINSICALDYSKKKHKYLGKYNLMNVVSHLGMDFDEKNAHEALFDTYACLYIINPNAEIFNKRKLARKYFNAMLKYDTKNVGYEQRKKDGNRWLEKHFNCNESSLNNISIETSNAIIKELEEYVKSKNLL